MAVFAITGRSGCGKSTVASLLKAKGAVTLDCDDLVHSYYRDCRSLGYQRTAAAFPEAVKQGEISRERLGKIVFADKNRLSRLEKIIHPLVIRDMREWIAKSRLEKGVFLVEVPLLFETKLEKYFDAVILVRCPRNILVKRLRALTGCSRQEALRRLTLFLPDQDKASRSKYVIDNKTGKKTLRVKTAALWDKLIGNNQRRKP